MRSLVALLIFMPLTFPVAGTTYNLNHGGSNDVAGDTVNLDGDLTADFAYYKCGPTCPALRSFNGWTYGNGNWENQTYAHASSQTYIIPASNGGFGFSWNGGNPVYASTGEVFLIRSSQNHYYKLRLTAIDTSDLQPAAIEVERLYAFPQGSLTASMACASNDLVITITRGDGAGTDGDIFRASSSTGPGLSTPPGANIPGGGHTVAGPGAWTNVAVSELAGDNEVLVLGNISCGVSESDFSGDGANDIVWRNTGDGRNSAWYMSGATRSGYGFFPQLADTNWELAGTGDWNGDYKIDLLWRHMATGKNVVWYMNGLNRMSFAYLPTLSGISWTIQAVGDFDGDTLTDDIVWRNIATGENAVWYMSNSVRSSYAYLLEVTDLGWSIVGAGDFDDDGSEDLAWRHATSGKIAIWYMSGAVRTSYAYAPTLPDANWKIRGVADFNSDGRPDFLWRNTSTGANSFWYMNDTVRSGYAYLLKLTDQSWTIGGPR